jgi:hypothetical protein
MPPNYFKRYCHTIIITGKSMVLRAMLLAVIWRSRLYSSAKIKFVFAVGIPDISTMDKRASPVKPNQVKHNPVNPGITSILSRVGKIALFKQLTSLIAWTWMPVRRNALPITKETANLSCSSTVKEKSTLRPHHPSKNAQRAGTLINSCS